MAPKPSKVNTGTDAGERAPWETGPDTEGAEIAVVETAVTDDTNDYMAQDPQYVEGQAISMRKAAQWVNERHFGPRMTDIIGYIATKSISTSDLNAVIMERLAERMLDGDGPDAILDPFGTIKGEAMLGKAIEVVGADFLEGDFEESFPWYTTMEVLDRATGKTIPVTTGGEKVVIQVAVFDMRGMWPQVCKITKATKATKAGFFPLELAWAV